MTKDEFYKLCPEVTFRDGLLVGNDYMYKSCVANVAEGIEEDGSKWATIYTVESSEPNQGHCQTLLQWLQYRYKDYDFGCTVALNDTMRHILQKLNIKEYN